MYTATHQHSIMLRKTLINTFLSATTSAIAEESAIALLDTFREREEAPSNHLAGENTETYLEESHIIIFRNSPSQRSPNLLSGTPRKCGVPHSICRQKMAKE